MRLNISALNFQRIFLQSIADVVHNIGKLINFEEVVMSLSKNGSSTSSTSSTSTILTSEFLSLIDAPSSIVQSMYDAGSLSYALVTIPLTNGLIRTDPDGTKSTQSQVMLYKINGTSISSSYLGEAYVSSAGRGALGFSGDGLKVFISSKSDSNDYGQYGDVYNVNTADLSVTSHITLFTNANWGWFPYIDTAGKINHFSFAGYYRVLDATRGASISPTDFNNESVNFYKTKVNASITTDLDASYTKIIHEMLVNNSPTGAVIINDTTPELNQTLTASNTLADADGLGVITYTWKAGTSVLGTGSNYTVTAAEVGKAIRVEASYVDGKGVAENMTSSATALVIGTPVTPVTGLSWNAQVVSLNNYKEPNEKITDVIKNGVLHISPSLSSTGYYWSSFTLPMSQKFDGDNFKFEARVKNTEADGGLSAYDVGLSFASSASATNSAGAAFMGEDWAVSYTSISALGEAKTGIDSMVVSLSDWHTLAVETKNQKVTTYYDGKQIDQYAYTGKIGEIDSLAISTKGSGSVDWIKANSNGIMILEDNFDATTTQIITKQPAINPQIDSVFQGKNTADKWVGSDKNDKAFGDGGDDILSGGLGDDTIDGGNGNDKITGDKGADVLSGGSGKDRFIFKKGDSSDELDYIDTILDLSKGDSIDLSRISKKFNFIRTVSEELDGWDIELSDTKADVYIANFDGDNYLVYETVKDGSSYEIIAIGSEIPDVSSWTLKSGILSL